MLKRGKLDRKLANISHYMTRLIFARNAKWRTERMRGKYRKKEVKQQANINQRSHLMSNVPVAKNDRIQYEPRKLQ